MDFWDRMKGTIDKGIDSSRDLLGKARDKAKDVGERGVIRFEIMQLESQAEKLVAKLGSLVYDALAADSDATINRSTVGVSNLLAEIDQLRTRISEKEAALEVLSKREGAETEEQ